MKKKNVFGQMSVWLIAFLVLALVFLAVGLGTLGTARSVGKSYTLNAKSSADEKTPCIIIGISEPGHGTEGHVHSDNLYVKRILVNVGTVYAPFGENATLRIARGTSEQSSFTQYVDMPIANPNVETGEGANKVLSARSDLYNWVELEAPDVGWRIANYTHYRLTALDYSVMINEIVFIAQDTSVDPATTVLLDASVSAKSELSFDANAGETAETARLAAEAILDAQRIPPAAQSSFFRFGAEEAYSLMTIKEMRAGGSYNPNYAYRADQVNGPFGIDLLALGTLIFGMTPFGLRFMPFLASFGVLLLGYFFVKKLTGSEKAGFFFAVLYALCGVSLSLGHFGTPLMIGVFFLFLSLYACACFYLDGLKRASRGAAAPLMISGLAAAAAIGCNGAFLIPVLGVVALFVAGLIRQRNRDRVLLAAAIEEAERETAETAPGEEEAAEKPAEKTMAAKRLAADNRFKSALSASTFFSFLVFGTLLIMMLSSLPLYFTYLKIYDDPSAPAKSVFYFLWKAFAGGFAGVNGVGNSQSAWNPFYELFRGTGDLYAVTSAGALIAAAGILAGVAGAVIAIVRLVRHLNDEIYRQDLCGTLLLFFGIALCLVTAAVIRQGGLCFLFCAEVLLFALAARSAVAAESEDGKLGRAARTLKWVFLGLAVVCFLLFAVFVFSIPLPAAFLAKLL